MKKEIVLLSLLSVLLISCGTTQKVPKKENLKSSKSESLVPLSEFKQDTAKFVKNNFVDNKDKYVNKPLSALLNDLSVPVGSYLIKPGLKWDDCSGIILFFDSKQVSDGKIVSDQDPLHISIDFETPAPLDDARKLVAQGKGSWSINELNFYKNYLIKDIGINNKYMK